MAAREMAVGVALGVIMLALAGAALAEPQQEATASAFDGVWAPERREPPGGPGGPPNGGPQGQRPEGSFNLGGGGNLQPRGPRGGPPPAGFGPPGGPGGRGPRGPIEISADDQAKGLEQGDIRTRSIMTAAGKAKFATFDPLQHPTSNCRTPGLPSIAQIPQLQEWKISETTATIRHESYETIRTVRFDQTSHPDEPHSVLGHAYGKLDGSTLTIETGNLSEGWGGLGRNAPGSSQRTVRETYRLIDKDTIEGVIEIADPLFLTQMLRMPVRLKRQPGGTEIVEFPCDIEVAQRDYKYIRDGMAVSRNSP
jgi:hypothetical protein